MTTIRVADAVTLDDELKAMVATAMRCRALEVADCLSSVDNAVSLTTSNANGVVLRPEEFSALCMAAMIGIRFARKALGKDGAGDTAGAEMLHPRHVPFHERELSTPQLLEAERGYVKSIQLIKDRGSRGETGPKAPDIVAHLNERLNEIRMEIRRRVEAGEKL